MKIAGPIFVCIIMLTVIFGCTKPEEPRVERPSDIPEPYVENHTLHGPEDDLVIVRSQGAEYVQLNGLVFLWQHGTNLLGVYGKDGRLHALDGRGRAGVGEDRGAETDENEGESSDGCEPSDHSFSSGARCYHKPAWR